MPWDRASQALGTGSLGPEILCFLSTVRPNGRPHSAGVGLAEHGGNLYFTSGPETRKSRNLGENPACTLSLRLDGIDLILEGDAHRVVDSATLEEVAAVFRDGGWPAVVDGDAITAPTARRAPGRRRGSSTASNVKTAFGVGLREPHGASRWRF